MNRTESIKRFLTARTHADLAWLYCADMECQVNVAKDNGEPIQGEYRGKTWRGWTDGLATWKPFRIPWNAMSNPTYEDKPLRFDLGEHAEGIGMTGWDWKNKVSRWVGYDFDAIVGHSDKHTRKLTPDQLSDVLNALKGIPWVTIRKSSSGNGLHVYVFLDEIPTETHTEHAALARAILGRMSASAGFPFESNLDVCGGNMWVWHRRMAGTDGLSLIKAGETLEEAPSNWREHVKVISGSRKRLAIPGSNDTNSLDELLGKKQNTPLDAEHKKLITWLEGSQCLWWWDQDHYMLVTHTLTVKRAHTDLQLKGRFETNSDNLTGYAADHNCFLYPLPGGSWSVRRYGMGTEEHSSWEQDGAGWTRCFLNKIPDLNTACRSFGGLESPKGGYIFREASVAAQALAAMGVFISVSTAQQSRKCVVKEHRDGRILLEIEHDPHDRGDEMKGWLADKGKWTRFYNAPASARPGEAETLGYDDFVRHIVTTAGADCGWVIKNEDRWVVEPYKHVAVALSSLGHNGGDINSIMGTSVLKCWSLVNNPFQAEYPGNRQWNRDAAQLRVRPSLDKDVLCYPTWTKVLAHTGSGLDEALRDSPWACANGIQSGGDYLKCWLAALIQYPTQPLPYLFFYGPQNSGKSILHEIFEQLLTKGYKRADQAIKSKGDFNAELEGAVLCIIEETNLRQNADAYNKIKDWVTAPSLSIHQKGKTPFLTRNTTHWIQCANDHTYCPIFPGDTRITMSYVRPLDPLELIPKERLLSQLESEASDFLAELQRMELPPSGDRLRVPVVSTSEKRAVEATNESPVMSFIRERCDIEDGYWIKFSEFYDELLKSLEPDEIGRHTKIFVGRQLPPTCPKARSRTDSQQHIGNIKWKGKSSTRVTGRYAIHGDFLDVVGAKS